VLPLTSAAAGAAETDFLVEGFHNAIQTQLTKIGALEVIGRATVARYASTEMTPGEIGHELGVANVLQGSVLRVANDLQLSVQLTEAATGRQLWAEAYERSLTVEQLFDILEDVAGQIAGALEVALTPGDLGRVAALPTENVDAYELYLRGENLWAEGVFGEALAAYERAVTLEPDFAVAWARLVEVASWLFFSYDQGLLEVASQALDRVTALAPDAAATRVARGAYLMYVELDYEQAFDLFDSVLEARPNDAEVINYLGRVRAFQGRWDDAERHLRRALALDPFLSKALENLGNVLRNDGRFSDAARYLDRAAELSPEDGATAFVRMNTYLWGLGDTTTVRTFVDHGASSLAARRNSWRAHLAYLSRDADALEGIARDPLWAESAPTARYVWLTRVAVLRGDPESHALYADSLASVYADWLDGALAMEAVGYRDLIIVWRRSFLGVALALAGDEEGALREARLARELLPVQALDRDRVFRNIVLVHTFLGRTEEALDQLEHEVSLGNPQITPWRLRVDPDFDELRDHPRFQTLLELDSQS
jgi:TolB-like protein/Flp pilus assembly protein TadD